METGLVKIWNAERGFGFIVRDAGGGDCFIHYSQINPDDSGRRDLVVGDRVEFAVEYSPKGARAVAVQRIE